MLKAKKRKKRLLKLHFGPRIVSVFVETER